MSAALAVPVKAGRQSIAMVMSANAAKFHGFSERTVYSDGHTTSRKIIK